MNQHQEFDRFAHLAETHDELVQTILHGAVIIDELAGQGTVLDLLLSEARDGFVTAARALIDRRLNLYSETGIEDARRLQNEMNRYRDMVSWISERLGAADGAKIETAYLESEMKVLNDDE